MSFIADKIVMDGLTYDDVLLIPAYSEVLPRTVDLSTKFSKNIELKIPFVTAAMAQNENLKMVMDLTKEWDSLPIEEGGRLVTGVTVCRKEVLEDAAMRESVKAFMEEHKESTEFVNNNVELAGNLVAEAGIIEKALVAQKAIPYCGIVCIDGEEMKTMLSGYLNVLFEQDASSVGGKLPDDGFYYIP